METTSARLKRTIQKVDKVLAISKGEPAAEPAAAPRRWAPLARALRTLSLSVSHC